MSEAAAIPIYRLYGEDSAWPTPELLHHESIAERSIIHNWNIRPHRHPDLFQILYIRRGGATVRLDGHEAEAELPGLVLITPMCVHGFVFTEDVQGHVVTFPDFVLERFFHPVSGLRQHFTSPRVLNKLPPARARQLDSDFEQLADDFTADRPARLLALEAILGMVLVRTVRLLAEGSGSEAGAADRSVRHLRSFHELISEQYRCGWSIDDYAARLGITATRLNHICRVRTGRSALQLVHDRIMLEAKRNLVYTVMTISEIAYALGFSDPAYFSRFFAKRAGCSPSEFRRQRIVGE